MRILLDEDLDVRLRRHFRGNHQAETVQFRGWKGMKNGELLEVASADYDVLVTLDDIHPHQQDLRNFDLAVVILRARSKDLDDLAQPIPEVKRLLSSLRPGTFVRIQPPSDQG